MPPAPSPQKVAAAAGWGFQAALLASQNPEREGWDLADGPTRRVAQGEGKQGNKATECHGGTGSKKLGKLQAEADALQEELADLLHVQPGGRGEAFAEQHLQRRLQMDTEEALKKEIEALKRLRDRLRGQGSTRGGPQIQSLGEAEAADDGLCQLTSSSALTAKTKAVLARKRHAHHEVGRPAGRRHRRENWPGPLLRMRSASPWAGQTRGQSIYPSLKKNDPATCGGRISIPHGDTGSWLNCLARVYAPGL